MIYNKRGDTFIIGGVEYCIGEHVCGNEKSSYNGMNGMIVNLKDNKGEYILDVMFRFPDGSYKTREVKVEQVDCA